MRSIHRKIYVIVTLLFISMYAVAQQSWSSKYVQVKKDGSIIYAKDELGNTIPDFSGVGYKLNRKSLPVVPVVKTVDANGDNDEQTIQSAIDEVSKLKPDANGFRGAILLKKGTYKIPGTIRIKTSGVVLRGEGDETILIATGKGQRKLIVVGGVGELKEIAATRRKITDAYVPVGTKSFSIENTKRLKVGDSIVVYRPATQNWIEDIKMHEIEVRDSTSRQWDAAEYGLHYERVITKIEGNKLFIDNPIVMAMEEKYGGGEIYQYSYPGRITNVGVGVCNSHFIIR